MKRYLIILATAIAIALVGCSSQEQAKAPGMVKIAETPVENVQDKLIESALNAEGNTQPEQPDKKQPIVKQGSNLELPSGFPNDIIPIIENANITNTYEDGESFSVNYQTGKAFNEVVKIYKSLMEGSKLIMEDSQGDNYYTVNGTKDEINIFITVMKFTPDITTVSINSNTFDLTAVDEGRKLREEWSEIPNEADFTPVVLLDPATLEPPPLGLPVENKAIKMVADGMVIRVYVNEKPSDFDKIANDIIFKQKLVQNDDQSPYQDGDSIPVIYDMVDGKNPESNLVAKGMVEFKGNKYSLAEQTCTIELSSGYEYAPGSFEVKMQVYIPHRGDEYWFVGWNSREIYSINMPKYLIQSEGLEDMVEDLFVTEE